MKLLLDFLPIVIFFIVYKITNDIVLATAVLIPATILQIAYTRWATGKFEKMQLATVILVIVFGGMTVLLKDGIFIKWKPTVINWLFALVFVGSQFIGKNNIMEYLMGSSISLPKRAWQQLNSAWVLFFAFMGALNLYVAFNYSENAWVNFKLFGMLGLTLVFVVLQGLFLAKYLKESQ